MSGFQMAQAAQYANPAAAQPTASTTSISVPPGAPVQPADPNPVATQTPPAQPANAAPITPSASPAPAPQSTQTADPTQPINVVAPDETYHQFPGGTSPAIVNQVMGQYWTQQAGAQKATSNAQQMTQSAVGGPLLAVENGLTFNNADRLNGAAQAGAQYLSNLATGGVGQPTPGQAYTATRDAVNAEDQQFGAAHPVVQGALNIVGGLPLGGAIAKGALELPTLSAKVAEAVGAGTAAGAAYGAGADKSAPLTGLVTGGATGAVLGPAALGAGALSGKAADAVTGALSKTKFGQDAQAVAARYLGGQPAEINVTPPTTTQTEEINAAPATQVQQPAGTPAPVPAPQSVGAMATPPAQAAFSSPAEAAASQATGESLRVQNPLKGGYDPTIYVPGTEPTAAEIAGDANTSIQQKLAQQAPGQQSAFQAKYDANNDKVADYYDAAAGTPTTINHLVEARTQQMNQDLAQAWGNKTPVDATPVLDTVNGILAGPSGKIAAVRNALKPIVSNLYDNSGNLETDPEVLYGVRKDVANMLGKNATSENPTLKDAASQLGTVKDALDATIETGANGYQQYLKNYAANSQPINVSELLQEARPNLTNGATRQFSFPKYDRFMKDVVSDRQARGANPAKSIPDSTMDELFNIHAHLARLQNLGLGKASGSDTSMLNRALSVGAKGAAHVVAAHTLPVAGNFVVHAATQGLEKRASEKLTEKMLNPGEAYFAGKGSPAPTAPANGNAPTVASTKSLAALPGALAAATNYFQ